METTELKSKLTEYINTADERLLRIVNAVFESYQQDNDGIVAYRANGEAVSQKEYVARNQKALIDYRIGNFKTTESLKEKYKGQQGS